MKKIEVILLLSALFSIGIVYSQGGGVGVFFNLIVGDIVGPNITITKLGPTSARNITVNGTYSDQSDIANITVEVNSSNKVAATIDTSSQTWRANINLSEGWNRFYVLSYDEGGNFANATSSSQGASILSDTTNPVINLTSPQNSSSVANNSLITFKISDLYLSDVFYTINSGETTSFNGVYELKAGTSAWVDGANYIIINATDNVNNVERKNYTFTYSNTYAVVLDASLNTAKAEIHSTNSTISSLKDTEALTSKVDTFAAEISVSEYNKTLESLNIIENLTSAVSAIDALLQEILAADSSSQDNSTKTAIINAKLEQISVIKNTTVASVEVNLFDPNLTVSVGSDTKNNVSDSLVAAAGGLSAADQQAFETATAELQSKTTIENKVQTLTQTFLNGRTENITLFEKNVTLSTLQSGEFYINEFIDKNITGTNDLNANNDVANKANVAMTVVVADPIVRWSLSDSTGNVIAFTIIGNVPSSSVGSSKTVVTTVPAAGAGSSVTSGGGGGGGGGGGAGGGGGLFRQGEISVNKETLRVVLKQTESKIETLSVKNTGTAPTNVFVVLDQMKDFVSQKSLERFRLPIQVKPLEDMAIDIEFKAGEKVLPDIYPLELVLRSIFGEKKIATIIELESSKPLFDIDVNILPQHKSVLAGQEIFAEFSLFNVRGFGRVDVNLEYSIIDLSGNIIVTEHETLAVENQAKFVRNLLVPSNLKPGNYVVSAKVIYQDTVGLSSDTFEVRTKAIKLYPILLKGKEYYLPIGIGALAFASALFFILKYGRGRKYEIKAKSGEVKEEKILKIEEKIGKMEKELSALEAAYKSKFISEESYRKDKERIEMDLRKLKK